MLITVKNLEALNACADAINDFRRYVGESIDIQDYDLDCQLALIRGPLGKHWSWAVARGLLPVWSMHGVDLSGAYLRSLSFPRCYLAKADLSHADLGHASLAGCNLYRTCLDSANLVYANLLHADLSYASLRNANLRNACLFEARLGGADLRGADLTDAVLPPDYRNIVWAY